MSSVCSLHEELGSWDPYHGLLPESILGAIKERLLCLEGLFRELSGKVPRGMEGLLSAIADVFAKLPQEEDKLMERLVDNCLCGKGNGKLKPTGARAPAAAP